MVVKAEEWLDSPPGYAPGARVRRVIPEGSGTSGVMLVGEAAGGNEDAEGLPFRPWAEAGSVLERALWRAGVPRESLTITNVVCYRPPRDWLDGAPWEAEAIRFSRPMLDEAIVRARPRAILALGGVAMRELTGLGYGEKEGILTTRGFVVPALTARTTWTDDGSFVGRVDEVPVAWAGGTPIPVVGTLHPSFLRRGSKDRQADAVQAKVKSAGGGTAGMALLGLLIRDIQLAKTVADGGLGKFTYDDYRLGATLDDWREIAQVARSDRNAIISYDFETQDSLQVTDESEVAVTVRTVTQVQVSLRPGQALVSPWTPELLPLLREIIEGPGTKLDWNGRKFDRPLLRAMGIRTDLGRWVDGMDFWHHAQPDLPRGLQSAASFFCPEAGPWKHRSADAPLWYGALDVDMPQRVYAGLRRTLSLTRHPVSGVSLDQGHEDQVVRVAPVLDRMTLRGIPVDEDRRVALDREFTATITRLTGEMQGLYPEELRTLHPPGGFVRTPIEFVHVCAMCAGRGTVPDREKKRRARVECPECHGHARWESTEVPEGWTKLPFTAQVKCVCDWAKNVRQRGKIAEIEDCPACGNTGKVESTVTRWAKRLPFLPGSPDQVLRYIKHRRVEDLDRLEAKYRESARYADKPESWAAARTAWKIPTNHKTGQETTGEAELRRLAEKTGDPLLPRVLEFREVAKMRGTYVEGWKPGADGRVHPGFGFKPATGQLSCVAHWTPMRTSQGEVEIRNLHLGDYVWTHQMRWRRVVGMVIKGVAPMYEVRFGNGSVLTCTADHKLLVYFHECLQAMGYTRPDLGSVADLSFGRNADIGGNGASVQGEPAYDRLDSAFAYPQSGVCRAQGHTLFPVEDRGEESGLWKNAAELHRDCGRWIRVSDLLEGWQTAVRTQDSHGGSVGVEVSATEMGRSSHRREPEEQRTGQLGSGYAGWASNHSLPSSEGLSEVVITAINPVGSHEVYDITVEEDGSYSACGVFSHNSDSPNAQNFPTHSELAGAMKAMIRATPGKVMLKLDWKSFHLVTGSFEAQDADALRIARVDFHSFLTLVGLLRLERPEVAFAWSDDELRSRLQWWRKNPAVHSAYARRAYPAGMTFNQIRDALAKRVVYGWEFGQGPRSLYMLNQESFAGEAEARECQEALRTLFPRIAAWQERIKLQADHDAQLVSRHGFVRRFWDVFHRKPVADNFQPKGEQQVWVNRTTGQKWLLTPGDDAEAAIAFLPANDAFGIKRLALAELGARGWDEKFGLISETHDDFRFECPSARADEALASVKGLMEARSRVLVDPVVAPDGLWCAVECLRGESWGEMEEIKC